MEPEGGIRGGFFFFSSYFHALYYYYVSLKKPLGRGVGLGGGREGEEDDTWLPRGEIFRSGGEGFLPEEVIFFLSLFFSFIYYFLLLLLSFFLYFFMSFFLSFVASVETNFQEDWAASLASRSRPFTWRCWPSGGPRPRLDDSTPTLDRIASVASSPST